MENGCVVILASSSSGLLHQISNWYVNALSESVGVELWQKLRKVQEAVLREVGMDWVSSHLHFGEAKKEYCMGMLR